MKKKNYRFFKEFLDKTTVYFLGDIASALLSEIRFNYQRTSLKTRKICFKFNILSEIPEKILVGFLRGSSKKILRKLFFKYFRYNFLQVFLCS